MEPFDPTKLSLFDRMALIGRAEAATPLELIPPLEEKVASNWERVKTALQGENEFSVGRGQRPKIGVRLNVPDLPLLESDDEED